MDSFWARRRRQQQLYLISSATSAQHHWRRSMSQSSRISLQSALSEQADDVPERIVDEAPPDPIIGFRLARRTHTRVGNLILREVSDWLMGNTTYRLPVRKGTQREGFGRAIADSLPRPGRPLSRGSSLFWSTPDEIGNAERLYRRSGQRCIIDWIRAHYHSHSHSASGLLFHCRSVSSSRSASRAGRKDARPNHANQRITLAVPGKSQLTGCRTSGSQLVGHASAAFATGGAVPGGSGSKTDYPEALAGNAESRRSSSRKRRGLCQMDMSEWPDARRHLRRHLGHCRRRS